MFAKNIYKEDAKIMKKLKAGTFVAKVKKVKVKKNVIVITFKDVKRIKNDR